MGLNPQADGLVLAELEGLGDEAAAGAYLHGWGSADEGQAVIGSWEQVLLEDGLVAAPLAAHLQADTAQEPCIIFVHLCELLAELAL